MMVIGPEHALAQLAASLAFADAGANPSRIHLYADAAVATGAAPAASPLAEIVLAKPCGTIADGALTLHPADSAGALVLVTGIPRAARWVSGDDMLVSAGTVTDTSHSGDFRIGGTTPAGDDSPTLYAGGLVLLGDVVLD